MNESIEKHDTLNPKLFENNSLKPEIRKKAEEVVNEFLRLLAEDEVKLQVRDVILTGSNASFNYTKDSDVDLHILAKTVDLNDPDKLYPKLYNCYRRLFEGKFDISFYGIPVEVYVETESQMLEKNVITEIKTEKIKNVQLHVNYSITEILIVEMENMMNEKPVLPALLIYQTYVQMTDLQHVEMIKQKNEKTVLTVHKMFEIVQVFVEMELLKKQKIVVIVQKMFEFVLVHAVIELKNLEKNVITEN